MLSDTSHLPNAQPIVTYRPRPANQSIVIDKLPDAKVIKANDEYRGSLAALYDVTWKRQQPELVFVTRKVNRDPEGTKASVKVRDHITALEWSVEGNPPLMLLNGFNSRAIFVRDEYRYILGRIWEIIGKRGGVESGYVPKPDIEATDKEGPPYNPFEGLQIKYSGKMEVPGVIVTGSPGIGKSLFLFVLLAQRLLAQQTTVFQVNPGEFFIFHEDGVFRSGLVGEPLTFLPQHTWFLIDSNEEHHVAPRSFIIACQSSSRKLIMAASPCEEHFSFRKKNLGFTIVWMEPFTLEEIIIARQLQTDKTPISERDLEKFFQLYGPSARDAYFNADRLEEQQSEVEAGIAGLDYDTVMRTLTDVNQNYLETNFSYYALVARRLAEDPRRFYVEFASRNTADLGYTTYSEQNNEKGLELYRLFLKTPKARASAGDLLRAIVSNVFPLGGQWPMHRMVKTKKRPHHDEKNQRWRSDASDTTVYTLLIGQQDNVVTIAHAQGQQNTQMLQFAPLNYRKYPEDVSPKTRDRGFYVPTFNSQASFDALIYEPNTNRAVILQVTVKKDGHFIDPKGLKDLQSLGMGSVDLVIVSDKEGGTEVAMPFETTGLIKDVYRVVY